MGRPPRRRRQTEEGNASFQDPLTVDVSSSSQLGNPIFTPPPFWSQDARLGEVPINGFSSLENGFLDPLQDPILNAEAPGFTSLSRESHCNSSQRETYSSEAMGLTDNESMDMLRGSQTLTVNGSFASQTPTASERRCACLANLYSTLSSFQSLPPSSFPFSMGALTKATVVARDACHCEECPTNYTSALQNLMLLSTLVPLIAHEYGKLLEHVDERASKGGIITFRMGEKEQTLEQLHKHTFTVDCPMAFEMDLSAEEWRSMARKVIKSKVVGPSGMNVLGVVDELEQRQLRWHEHPMLIEFQHGTNCREHGPGNGQEHICMKLLSRARSSVEALKLQ